MVAVTTDQKDIAEVADALRRAGAAESRRRAEHEQQVRSPAGKALGEQLVLQPIRRRPES